MLAQDIKGLAGHRSGEGQDRVIPTGYPFRMGAWQTQQPVAALPLRQRAENLDLLPAHHIETARRVDAIQPRHKGDPRMFRMRHDSARDIRQGRGTRRIGRFDPAVAAADHAGQQRPRR